MKNMATMDPETEQQSNALAENISDGSLLAAQRIMLAMHPAEIADALEALPPARRRILWDVIDAELEGEILMEVGDEVRESLVRDMDVEELRAATEQLDLDDLADFVQSLPEHLTAEVLAGMGRQDRARLDQVLAYPEESAGGLMNLDAITVRGDVTLDVVLRYLRRRGDMPRQTDRLWVTDRYGRYQGELPLRVILTNSADTLVSDVSVRKIEPLNVLTSQTDVSRAFEDFNLVSAPVVDDDNTLLGRITIDDVVDVIREEAEQSVMSMAGLNQEDDIFAPVLKSARKRALWLGVNLLTALMASWVIAQFEGTLERVVTLAVLMSVVPSMGGIAGSQTLTLVIRGQALNQINKRNLRDLLTREVAVGLLNGILWATIVAVLVWLWFGDAQIGLIIGIALVINMATAAYAGAMLPVFLRKIGVDPALAGGVALTTITDVVGLVAFLGLATLLL
ncbi:MAG: magnesium transporter [Porticoccaceae bacterium]|jgi:magnesium transporter